MHVYGSICLLASWQKDEVLCPHGFWISMLQIQLQILSILLLLLCQPLLEVIVNLGMTFSSKTVQARAIYEPL